MRFSTLIFVGLCVLATAFGKTCDPTKGANTFNPVCDDPEEPYCMQTVGGTTPTYECAMCASNCDCDVDEFCSSKPGQIGTCVEFEPEGNDCRPLSGSQLANLDFSDEWKCAMTYSDGGVLRIDQAGVCIEQTCRYCDYRGNGGMPGCAVDSGIQVERRCVYPGKLVSTHSAPWAQGSTYENPTDTWWAIFFTFFIILIIVQCATGLLQILRGGSGVATAVRNSVNLGSTRGTTNPTKEQTSAHSTQQSTGTPN